MNAAAGSARIAALYRYPLKSGAGEALQRIAVTRTGLAHDRQWLLVTPRGRFLTQREEPRLALLCARVEPGQLRLSAPGLAPLAIAAQDSSRPCRVSIWSDECQAFDAGDAIAGALSDWLGSACRLVRFDADQRRLSSAQWSGELEAENAFSDGFPLLLIGAQSLADLNRRVGRELPMNRFRPNLVLEGLSAYDEDRIAELACDSLVLRLVKPCTRCVITSTAQESGTRDGAEPLRTLRTYRYDAALRGVRFGQNAIIVSGVGSVLEVGQELQVRWRDGGDSGPA